MGAKRSKSGTGPTVLDRRTFALGLACAPWALGCGDDAAPESNGDIVRLGIMSPDEDPSEARRMLGIGQMACREINDAGGLTINGKPFTVEARLIGFTEEEPADAVPRMLEEGVKFVVGPESSSEILGVTGDGSGAPGLPARDNGIILISGSATSPAISTFGMGAYFWRTVPPDDLQVKVAAQYLLKDKQAKTMGIIFEDKPYSRGLAAAVKASFEAGGGKVLQSVPFGGATKFIPDAMKYDYVAELKAVFAGKPQVLYLAVGEEVLPIGNGAVVQGYHASYGATPPIYVSVDGAVTSDLLLSGRPEFLDNLSGTIPTPDKTGADFKRFAAALAGAGLGEGINYESYRYDAFYIFALAIQRANSVDTAVVKEHIREVTLAAPGSVRVGVGEWAKAKAALLAGSPVNYDGASGPIELEPDGDPSAALYAIWRPKPKAGGGYEYEYSEVRSAGAD